MTYLNLIYYYTRVVCTFFLFFPVFISVRFCQCSRKSYVRTNNFRDRWFFLFKKTFQQVLGAHIFLGSTLFQNVYLYKNNNAVYECNTILSRRRIIITQWCWRLFYFTNVSKCFTTYVHCLSVSISNVPYIRIFWKFEKSGFRITDFRLYNSDFGCSDPNFRSFRLWNSKISTVRMIRYHSFKQTHSVHFFCHL